MTGTSRYSLAASELNFRDILQILGRNKILLLVNIALGLAAGFLLSMLGNPKWEAESQIEIQGRTQSSPGSMSTDAISQIVQKQTDFDILTQISILKSPEMYYATLSSLGRALPRNKTDFDNNFPKVKIEQESTSKVVSISVTAGSEQEATEFAAALPEVYKKAVDDTDRNRIKAAIVAVEGRLKDTNNRIAKAIAKLAKFQRDKQIVALNKEGELRSSIEQAAENQYSIALAEREGAESELRSLRASLADIPKTKTDNQTETNREQIEIEKSNLHKLVLERSSLLAKYKPNHPLVQAADDAIQKQEAFIAAIPKNVTRTISHPNPEYEAHLVKIRNAEAGLRGAEAKASRYESILAERKVETQAIADTTEEQIKIDTELTALRKTHDRQQETLDELNLRNNPNLESPIRILSGATLFGEQTAPKWTINLILGAGLGFLLGVFVCIARDLGLDKVNYPAEAINVAGADILARIPVRSKSRSPLIDDPQSARAFEAYRLLRAGIVMKLQQVGQGAFLVTSTTKGEGKTVVSGNLGVAMALDGKLTCIVDCNLREPKLHKLFRVENNEGLTDVLLNRVTSIQSVCLETQVPSLSIITAGTKLANPTEALATPEMLVIVEQLKGLFDVVIFDCPDAYSVADTQEMTRHVRNVLYIVELGQTNKSRMEQALSFVRQASGRVLGIALNKDPQARGRYS